MKRLLAVVAGLALALVGTMAVAAWLSSGNGGGSVTAGSMAAPTAVAATHEDGTGDVTVSWTASAGAPAPTGYYVLRAHDGDAPEPACGSSASAPVTATTCTDTDVPLGTFSYVVVALFHKWTGVSAPSADVVIARAGQTVSFTSSPTSPTYGGTYALTATGGASGSPIEFGSSTPSVCTVSGSTASFVHAGTCTLTADQAGSQYYDAAPQATQQFVVAKATQTITFSSVAPTGVVVGGPGYMPVATGGGSGSPVTFSIDASATGICSISGGVVTFQHVGTCVIDADQAGDADHLAANRAQQSVAVGKGSQAINFTSAAPADAKVSGSPYTVTATGGPSSNPVTFSSATPSVCTVAGSTVSFTGAGTCTIDANQAGSADYLAATQVQQSFGVTRTDQSISFTTTAPSNATVGGATYTVAATATSGLDVVLTSATTSVCTITGSTVSFVSAGTCTINADQAGNATYNAAPQKQQSFSVGASGPVITACTRNVTSGEITVTWSPFTGAVSYRLRLAGGDVSPVTSPFTTTTIGKNHSGTVSVVAVTAAGDVPGPAWTYDGSGVNQACHQ
ncbi:MAG TPA: hypothetical protein VFE07_07345 [Marmoricola sp.]|nr:hypothetical protein [Marmoricola sp.]